ncbi:unnamed protein product [Ranitomeya imitator]|uniref:NADP-dependent oxidoreductase domain-containing protein n=1 Tax=Ranitomeya imitator TaxID=111125 RepID=A0ABN9M2P1_9NEOB|nr:unnamed protein product [Ranitomeya imitator]
MGRPLETREGYSVLGQDLGPVAVTQGGPGILVAKKLNRSPAQVALRYLLQRGCVVLAKSFSPERIKQNFQVFDFELSDEDMKSLDGVNKNMRYLINDYWKESPKYPYDDEF